MVSKILDYTPDLPDMMSNIPDTMSALADGTRAMSYQELKYATSFATTLIVALLYDRRIDALNSAGYFDGDNGMVLTGRALLILVAAIVGAGILGQILLAIGSTIAGGEVEMDEDERDRLIELKAMNWAFSLFGAGLLAALAALALGWSAFDVLHYIIYAMIAAGLFADAMRVFLHRRGV